MFWSWTQLSIAGGSTLNWAPLFSSRSLLKMFIFQKTSENACLTHGDDWGSNSYSLNHSAPRGFHSTTGRSQKKPSIWSLDVSWSAIYRSNLSVGKSQIQRSVFQATKTGGCSQPLDAVDGWFGSPANSWRNSHPNRSEHPKHRLPRIGVCMTSISFQ